MPKLTSINPTSQAEVVYAAHYTTADRDACVRVTKWLSERGFKLVHLARLARVHQSTLTQILKGYYDSSPSKQLRAVEAAMRHRDDVELDVIAPVETTVYKLVHTACQMARRYRNFSVITGYVGTGKTYSLKCYKADNDNTILIEATPTMTTSSLINHLHRAVLGFDSKANLEIKFRDIVDALKNTNSLLIIDEAETLTPHQLHTLRRLRDLGNIGIVLAGTENLRGLISPEHGQFDQIRSRAGFWPETITKITLEDAAAMVQSGFGDREVPDEVIQRMYDYSRGSARMLTEGLIAATKEFGKGRSLDVKLIDAVAKQALCLQAAN